MSTLPTTEAILLEIHQSLGCPSKYTTVKKNKFAKGQGSLDLHKGMGEEVLNEIFDLLEIDPLARAHALNNLMEFGNAYKHLEVSTWTFAADQQQILWMLLGYFYMPGLARYAAFWNIASPLDKGMPSGRFWYLPELREINGRSSLYLPVAQVVDWLLDLLGMSLEEFADMRCEASDGVHDGLKRSLYNWRKETTPNPDSFRKYFSDDIKLEFKGSFILDNNLQQVDQFAAALEFVGRKGLTADKLRQEIPITKEGLLEAILDNTADEGDKASFVRYLLERYAMPSARTVRQRFLFARMVQDGYSRLLKFLCPDVDRLCADALQNKVLQLVAIYQYIYNTTIDAWRHCNDQGEAAENAWFEEHLPYLDKQGLFLSILPSLKKNKNLELIQLLNRHFFETKAGAILEDHVGHDEESVKRIAIRNAERYESLADERSAELDLILRIKNSSPWRALQHEHRFWVVAQVVKHDTLSPRARDAAIQRLSELALTPSQIVQSIILKLHSYLHGERKQQPKDTHTKVQALLDEVEACEGSGLWRAFILQYKAKHLLASNDFEGAGKLFLEALDACSERNFGRLHGEIARDCLAIAVANQRLIPGNHQRYYRDMLAGGVVEGKEIPCIEDTANWAADYFWETLYNPYPDFERKRPLALDIVKESIKFMIDDDQEGLSNWINRNRNKLSSPLRIATGDTLLMFWIKVRNTFLKHPVLMGTKLLSESQRFDTLLENWRRAIGLLVQQASKQLHIADFKGQTPLMLLAEAGDTKLVRIMLQAGADPDMQDWHGMTALHAAIKSQVDSCVDVLLDHPCLLSISTIDGQSPLHTAVWSGNLHATKRLLQLAPQLVSQRNSRNMTPLEQAEYLIENPDALQVLNGKLMQGGRGCTSQSQLECIVSVLEEAIYVKNG